MTGLCDSSAGEIQHETETGLRETLGEKVLYKPVVICCLPSNWLSHPGPLARLNLSALLQGHVTCFGQQSENKSDLTDTVLMLG